ncbi:MAG: hypothetical protein JWN40_3759 [Phycisphaerales bacterium]|nr:hypothetical protein [Phycisphaerales bacterium]
MQRRPCEYRPARPGLAGWAVLLFYALEVRSPWFVLAFAGSCVLGAAALRIRRRTAPQKGRMAGIVLRRFGRIFFLLAAGVSLLLCVAAVGLWVWSGREFSAVVRDSPGQVVNAGVSRGEFELLILRDVVYDPDAPGARHWRWGTGQSQDLQAFATEDFPDVCPPVAGFFFGRSVGGGVSQTLLLLPMGFVVLLTALLPLSAAISIRRRRRAKRRLSAGHCPGCGYDCRATPGRCSECGRVFAAENTAASSSCPS